MDIRIVGILHCVGTLMTEKQIDDLNEIDDEIAGLRMANALYASEVERIWAMMPHLRNTDSHYELFEAVHERIAELQQEIESLKRGDK